MPFTFSESRRNDLDRDYLADFRALGLLEVQPGKSFSSMFRMRRANRVCEREKLGRLLSRPRGDGEPNVATQSITAAHICVYGAAGNVIEAHEHKGDFKEW
jgi:hypothetical protein